MLVGLAAFLALLLIFTLVLRAYDTFNLGIFLYEGSYAALGQNPYAVLSIPSPPNRQLLSFFAFLAYAGTGFDLASPVVFYKAVNGVLAVLSALLVANMVGRVVPSGAARSRVFVALLLSAPIFFFSFIHVQLDLFGIFWSLLALYLYFFAPALPRWDFLRLLVAVALLSYATYAYVIPVAFFPALIIYEPSLRRRLVLVAAVVASVAMYLIPYFYLQSYLPINPVGATAASANSAYSLPFVIGNFPITGFASALLLVWVAATILLPILLRKLGVDVIAATIVSVVLVFLILPIYNGDEFIWVLPWLTLGIAVYSRGTVSWRALLLLQCILLPLLVVFNFYDGLEGLGTGVFYLFNPQFSDAVVIYTHVPHALLIAQILMGSVFAALAYLVVRVAVSSRRRPIVTSAPDVSARTVSDTHEAGSSPDRSPSGRRRAANPGRGIIARWVPVVMIGSVVILLVGAATLELPVAGSFESDSPQFPVGIFLVHPPVNANLSYTVVNGGKTVELPPTNPALNGSVEFLRDTDAQNLRLGLDLQVASSPTTLYNTTVVESANLKAQVLSTVDLPVNTSNLTPSVVLNTSQGPPVPAGLTNANPPTFGFSGDSLVNYHLPVPASRATTYSFFFRPTGLPFSQNVVWSIATGVVTAELVALPSPAGLPQFE
ncbi:MAG: hypothetical protein ACRD6W_05065, partial [Nitrososphaerales archaeon]